MEHLPYLLGQPLSTGDLRSQNEDFKVFELIPYLPSGEGEHVYIHVRKTGLNTVYIARQIAKQLGVKESLVSYAGLKDKFAVCEQYFAVHLPGKSEITNADINIQGVEVLAITRHHKKLRTGGLIGNRFELTLKNVTDIKALTQRWAQIIEHGVPNYFGEQRFGINQQNLDKAAALFAGEKVRDKKKRGLYLSAARSFLFNQFIAERINHHRFSAIECGDVCMLAGSQSVFLVDQVDDSLIKRFNEFDLDLTAPMWGRGRLMTSGQVFIAEQALAEKYRELSQGLENFGLKQERRRMRLHMQTPMLDVINDQQVVVKFCLPAGSYATAILRELIQYQDVSAAIKENT